MLHSPLLQAPLEASSKTLVLPITTFPSLSIISFHGFIASTISWSEEFTNSNYNCYSSCNCFNSETPVVQTRIRTQIESHWNFSLLCRMVPGHTQPPIQFQSWWTFSGWFFFPISVPYKGCQQDTSVWSNILCYVTNRYWQSGWTIMLLIWFQLVLHNFSKFSNLGSAGFNC